MSIGIVGLGYVGLPLAVAFAEAGNDVIGVDVDARKIAALKEGVSHIEDVPSEQVQAVASSFEPTTRFAALASADAILICVPTPLSANREPELGPLIDSATSLAGVLQNGQLVVLESTTYPGTTRERLLPLLEESGLAAGRDFNLAYSPERVDPGREDRTLRNTPKVVGGLTDACCRRAEQLYRTICDEVVTVSTPEVAELSKLLENIYRSVNIALVNELAMLADRMEIDIWEVIDAAATKPYGFTRFDPGPGMGGHCLPVDPFYLAWKAREYDLSTEFIELAGEINRSMPPFVVSKVQGALERHGRPLRGSRVLVLGAAYKRDVADVRESPSLDVIGLLVEHGALVDYHDPHVPALSVRLSERALAHADELPVAKETVLRLESVDLWSAVAQADCVVICTDHSAYEWETLAQRARLIVDTRNALRDVIQSPAHAEVVKL